jgi:NADH dehydrogenase
MVRERFFLELEPPGTLPREAPHVVIVGGGFAGASRPPMPWPAATCGSP